MHHKYVILHGRNWSVVRLDEMFSMKYVKPSIFHQTVQHKIKINELTGADNQFDATSKSEFRCSRIWHTVNALST